MILNPIFSERFLSCIFVPGNSLTHASRCQTNMQLLGPWPWKLNLAGASPVTLALIILRWPVRKQRPTLETSGNTERWISSVKLFRGMSNSFVSFRRRCIITEMWINPKVTLIVQSKLEWLTPKTTVHKSLSFLWRERILAERNSKSLDKFLERNYYLLCFSILQLNYAINFYVARKKYKQSLKSFDKANFMKTHRLRKMRSVGGKHKEGIFFTKKGVGIQVHSFYYF